MKIKNALRLLGLFFLFAFLFLSYSQSNPVNAQCTTSSYKCCYGACRSGYRTVSSGGTRCCATQGGCDASCNCAWTSCRVISYVPPCNNCVRCVPICSCWCNTCSPPACPSGTSTTNRGSVCYYGSVRRNCGYSCSPWGCGFVSGCLSSSRNCWYNENNPAPTTPTAINAIIGGKTCDLGNAIRVPHASSGSFLARGSINRRAGDSIGYSPLLRYQYRIPSLGLQSGLLATTTRWSTSLNLVQGQVYDVHALANSRNRCSGSRNSAELVRNFSVNYRPEIRRIDPVGNPNNGVSGSFRYDGSSYFPCEIDNPKTFRVTFRDRNGCGDLWTSISPSTPYCGPASTPSLLLRAVRQGTTTVFASAVGPNPGTISCNAATNEITAEFTLSFINREEVVVMDLQAMAGDILGDTSGWVTRGTWIYDGIRPNLEMKNEEGASVLTADEFNVEWRTNDRVSSTSGIRGVKLSANLTEGEIFKGEGHYGPITYTPFDGLSPAVSIPVHTSLTSPTVYLEAYMRTFTAIEATSQLNYPADGSWAADLVNIGVNQDGVFGFQLEAVDRACNYNVTTESRRLFTPWIATRGGLVHSTDGIDFEIKRVTYDTIPISFSKAEETSLSTELLTVERDVITSFGEMEHLYDLRGYDKKLNSAWYVNLLGRAMAQHPVEGVVWTQVGNGQPGEIVELDETELINNCKDGRHVYFINASLVIHPEKQPYYENLGKSGVNGCIFVVKDNLRILEGDYKSIGGSLAYDIVRGYFVVDGEINIEFADGGRDVRDGLKVVGGLFATGGEKSIRLGRSLQLKDNFLYPTLIVFHDARYLDLSREVLGYAFGGGYVRDVGLIE